MKKTIGIILVLVVTASIFIIENKDLNDGFNKTCYSAKSFKARSDAYAALEDYDYYLNHYNLKYAQYIEEFDSIDRVGLFKMIERDSKEIMDSVYGRFFIVFSEKEAIKRLNVRYGKDFKTKESFYKYRDSLICSQLKETVIIMLRSKEMARYHI